VLILVAHGSRDPRWRASVELMTEAVAARLGPGKVALAYMDLTPPTLMDVASQAARAGARRVQVLPLFLAAEGHVERDVGPLVEQVRKAWRALEVELLPPLGRQPEIQDALARIAERTDGSPHEP
jgi:sirohydrochlorin cobaltochelatase